MSDAEERVLLRLSEILGIPVQEISDELDDKQYYDYQSKPVAYDVDEEVSFYLSEHADEFPGVEVVPAPCPRLPERARWPRTSRAGSARSTREESRTKRYKDYGPNDLVGKTGLEQHVRAVPAGSQGRAEVPGELRTRRSSASSARRPPCPATTWSCRSTSTRSGSPSRPCSDGIEHTRTIFDESQVPTRLPRRQRRRGDRDGSDDRRHQGAWPRGRATTPRGSSEGCRRNRIATCSESARGAHAQPGDPAVVRARFDVQAVHRAGRAAARVRGLRQLLRVSRRSTSIPGDTTTVVPQLDHREPRHDLGRTALKVSCDTVFYQLGRGLLRPVQRRPARRGRDAAAGEPPAVRVRRADEARPPVRDDRPDPRRRRGRRQFAEDHPEVLLPDEQSWLPGDDILMSIGQGFVTVTPMQLAVAYSAIANGGKICRPHVVDQHRERRGRDGADGQRALQQANAPVHAGGARLHPQRAGDGAAVGRDGLHARSPGSRSSEIPIAGKTGTAQRPPFQDTSWFAAMVPANDPQYVIVAMVEQGGHGSTSAAPIVRQVIEGIYGIDSTGVVDGGVTD